jgi:chromosome segregation ATPase
MAEQEQLRREIEAVLVRIDRNLDTIIYTLGEHGRRLETIAAALAAATQHVERIDGRLEAIEAHLDRIEGDVGLRGD